MLDVLRSYNKSVETEEGLKANMESIILPSTHVVLKQLIEMDEKYLIIESLNTNK